MKYNTLFFRKLGKMSQYLSSAAVVIGALRIKRVLYLRYNRINGLVGVLNGKEEQST